MMKSILISATVAFAAWVTPVMAELRLVMVEQHGCVYCAKWDDEIGHIYPKTDSGAFAPLLRVDLRVGPPEGMTYKRRVNFTPTFILMQDGQEIDRLEGYPGEDFFWALIERMLETNTDFEAGAS